MTIKSDIRYIKKEKEIKTPKKKSNLKNWKEHHLGDVWYQPLEKYSYVKVWKTGLSLKEMKRRGKIGTYIVYGRVGRYDNQVKRYFKTKSQAIKYAKEYMEKN